MGLKLNHVSKRGPWYSFAQHSQLRRDYQGYVLTQLLISCLMLLWKTQKSHTHLSHKHFQGHALFYVS